VQHVGIIPGKKTEAEQEAQELRNVALALQGIKNNLIDFRNLVK